MSDIEPWPMTVAPIDGMHVIPLNRIPDERGTVYHMLRCTDDHFQQFGEIYFSSIYDGVVKGWHLHHEMGLNYCCIHGRVKVVVYDPRDDSPTKGHLQEVFLGPDNHALLIVPPRVWNGFKGLGPGRNLVANCATLPHGASQSERMDPFVNPIPYDWNVRCD